VKHDLQFFAILLEGTVIKKYSVIYREGRAKFKPGFFALQHLQNIFVSLLCMLLY